MFNPLILPFASPASEFDVYITHITSTAPAFFLLPLNSSNGRGSKESGVHTTDGSVCLGLAFRMAGRRANGSSRLQLSLPPGHGFVKRGRDCLRRGRGGVIFYAFIVYVSRISQAEGC